MNIALVDDIMGDREVIAGILREYALNNNVGISTVCFSSGEDFIKNYRPYLYNVIFMDIYMAGIDGINAVEKIRRADSEAIIIFMTTSKSHYIDAFRFHAYEYIIKPAEKDRVFCIMDDILKLCRDNGRTLSFTYNREEIKINCRNIVSVISNGHYTEITDIHGEVYMPRVPFKNVSDVLEEDRSFLILNRGVLVNMDYITNFTGGICYITGNRQFPVNIRNQKKIEQVWRNYTFDQIRMECAEGRIDYNA